MHVRVCVLNGWGEGVRVCHGCWDLSRTCQSVAVVSGMEQIALLNQKGKKKNAHTHSRRNNYSFSGAVSRLLKGPAVTQSCLNYTVLVTLLTA